MEDIIAKRKFLALIEEVEVDENGNILVAAEEVATEPVQEEVVEAVEEPVQIAVVEAVQEEATEEPAEEVVEEATEEVVEEAAEEPAEVIAEEPAEEVAVTLEEAAGDAVEAVGEVAQPKYVNKSFAQKMMLADEVIQDRYDELKNYALRFKKLKARISKKFDSINQGRLQFVKLSVAGKTLKLYLNMDINEVDPKFRCKDMTSKVTYETVPVMLRVKSGRAVRYAKILIDQCAEKHGLVENKKFQEVDAMQIVEDFLAAKEAKNNAEVEAPVEE